MTILILSFLSCETEKLEKPLEFETYSNHDISACGINDPLLNLHWLNEMFKIYQKDNYQWTVKISLYKNKSTNADAFLIESKYRGKMANHAVPPDEIPKFIDCKGIPIFDNFYHPSELIQDFEFVILVYERKVRE